jgi:hypothetical protein
MRDGGLDQSGRRRRRTLISGLRRRDHGDAKQPEQLGDKRAGIDASAESVMPNSATVGVPMLATAVGAVSLVRWAGVERPSRFEHHRYVGDKRTQLVYDLDSWDEPAVVEQFVALGVGIAFAPDTLAEARNRGYHRATPGARRLARAPRS